MKYFDTDVLINSYVDQNLSKHSFSIDLIESCIIDNSFLISWLSIQEVGFVLGKLKQDTKYISSRLNELINSIPATYGSIEFQRAIQLATQIGFTDFNDCLHIAVAEQHCTDFYTYNRADFIRIKPFSKLNIHILE